jgi:hypothetical protein
MKNQYFGDINDYRKYGLLRAVLQASGVRMLLAWMLTPDNGGTDGKFVSYLQEPGKWSRFDPFLFNKLKMLLEDECERRVRLIEETDLLPNAEYFCEFVPDAANGRRGWFNALLEYAEEAEFVFLDPDNGLEVQSKPYGSPQSSKYLYWSEVETLWQRGKSLLIYQHFIREKRDPFEQRMLKALKESTPGSFVEAFATSNVLFLMALQPEHLQYHKAILDTLNRKWLGEINHRKLKSAPYARRPTARRPFVSLV